MIEQQQTIIQIVPRLPPAIDGVGDYALNLARQLRKDFNVQTHFIVGNPTWQGETVIEEFPVSHISDSSANSLVKVLNDRSLPVLLHYVGYGYAKRGCPVWLVEALKEWKRKNEKSRLVTMFHEIAASGPIGSSSFWLSGLQRNLAERLVSLSDRLITSNQLYAQILEKLSGGKHCQIPALPVFSNIGEPEEVPQLRHRTKNLVIFGSTATRRRAYGQSQEAIEAACNLFQIEKILDIGTPVEESPDSIGSTPLVIMGRLPPQQISDILLNSFSGFLNYSPNFLGKSGIFAAYSSHGILAIQDGIIVNKDFYDGIRSSIHYLSSMEFLSSNNIATSQYTKFNSIISLQTIATNAYQWYQDHSLHRQSKAFYESLYLLN
jgi:hypothetical protein